MTNSSVMEEEQPQQEPEDGSDEITLGNNPRTPSVSASHTSQSSGIVPQLLNIVVTVNLGCELDLKMLALRTNNAEYSPEPNAKVIMRMQEPRGMARIFSSGRMVCTGAKSEEQARFVAKKFASAVQKLGYPVQFLDFKIRNMIATCDVKFFIRLEILDLFHHQSCIYEPELVPRLIYKMDKPEITFTIFASGKIILTGAKVMEEINKAFENIYPVLQRFRKT